MSEGGRTCWKFEERNNVEIQESDRMNRPGTCSKTARQQDVPI